MTGCVYKLKSGVVRSDSTPEVWVAEFRPGLYIGGISGSTKFYGEPIPARGVDEAIEKAKQLRFIP